MRNFYFLCILSCCTLITSIKAQDQLAKTPQEIRQATAFMKWDESSKAPAEFLQSQKTQWGLGSKDEFAQTSAKVDFLGIERIRFQQTHDGLPVIGAEYTLHRLNGKIRKSSGNIYPMIDCETSPRIDQTRAEEQALNLVLNHQVKGKKLSIEGNDLNISASRLCIVDKAVPNFSGEYTLAYEFTVTAANGQPVKEVVYIDALIGNAVFHYSEICHHNITSPASGYHYRDITINVDSVSPSLFQLRDTARNIEINRVINNDPFMLETELINNTDNDWTYDEGDVEGAATDAMYCATTYYDFLQGHFNRDGIDDLNGPLICNINVPGFSGETFFVNAFWDGISTNYGAGDCDNYGPLTTLSIVSHEFTHGLTDYTSQLVYAEEPGALNESMSDIFGETLDYLKDPDNFNWVIGDELIKAGSTEPPIRDMSDPNNLEAPKYYKGDFWDEDQEVHANSGVMNYWYYLIANGDSSVNEAGDTFAIEGLGIESAIQIVYLMQTAYLTSTSDYEMAYLSSVSAAEDIYGLGAPEVQMVEDAWKAVGVAEREAVDHNIALYLPTSIFFSTTCLNADYISIDVELQNTGLDTVILDEPLLFEVFVGFEFNPVLEDTVVQNPGITLLPGESHTFSLIVPHGGSIPVERIGSYESVTVNLLREDDIANDNEREGFTQFVNEDPDMGLLYHELFYAGSSCDEKNVSRIELVFENASCSNIPAGTVYTISLNAGQDTYSQEDSLFFEMEAGGYNFAAIDITQGIFPDYYGDVSVTIQMEGDMNLDNDTIHLSSWNQLVLSTESLDFTDDLEGDFLQIESSEANPVTYQNDEWLAFTNLSLEMFDYVTCYDDIEGHYDVNANTKGSINMCIDTRGMNDPKLVFDAVFFDGFSAASSMPEHYATIFEVIINGERQALIYEQEDGVVEEHTFTLPAEYVGEVQIYVATFYREGAASHELGIGAWILFDDFRIEQLTSTRNVEESNISLYPNPVSTQLYIAGDEIGKTVQLNVFNLLGQPVITRAGHVNGESLDVSQLPEGSYYLQIKDQNNELYSKSFMIQR